MRETISKKQLREFGILIGFGFPFLIGFLLPVLLGHELRVWTLWIGAPGFILGLISPRFIHYPFKVWMAFGYALGWVNSHIILGFVYIFVVQPIAFIMRFTGYDPLRIRRKGEKTYRENKQNHNTDLTRLF